MALRVLVIGATGVFGARIAARLAHDARFELTLAGRTRVTLERLRERIGDASGRRDDGKPAKEKPAMKAGFQHCKGRSIT